MRFLLTALLTTAVWAPAEGLSDARIGAPSLGFVYDAVSRSVRPITGTPGAALLGDPVNVGFPIARAVVSAERRYMLALPAEGALRLIALDGSPAREIAGALRSFTHIALSPSGSAAVLYDEASSRIQTIAGLPEDPVIRKEFSTVGTGPAVVAPAVTDDGATVLFAGESLWLLDSEAGASATSIKAAAVSFRPGTRDAVAVSRAGELYALRAEGLIMIGAVSGIGEPVAVRLAEGGERAYVAFSKGTLAAVELPTGAAASVSCECSVTALEPMQTRTLFRLNAPAGAPLMLLDVSGAELRTWFIPAAVQESER